MEEDFFLKNMKGVKPFKKDASIVKKKTPNKKDVTKNLPGSGNLSDFHIITPRIIGGSTVAR